MLHSQEEVLCFYVQDIVKYCRTAKENLDFVYSQNSDYLIPFGYTLDESIRFFEANVKELNYYIKDVLDFVTSLPRIYKIRDFAVTGATNDQVYIENWQYLEETFQGYMDKISRNLKFYYENIGKFYNPKGELDKDISIKIDRKYYTYNEIEAFFGLSINYLFDVSPLVYYDKFSEPLK